MCLDGIVMKTLSENEKTKSTPTIINLSTVAEIELVEKELIKSVNTVSNSMKQLCLHIINSGGKRIRPLLLFYSCRCLGPITNQTTKAATAAELIHLASLVHDDIIDDSNLRHNKITLNYKNGNHTSVLVGDYLFAKAFEILCCNQISNGMEYMVEAIQAMCEGEILQALEIKNPSFDFENYYQRIEKKTAKLISASCKTGASISSSETNMINSMEQYGLNLGYAFQIVDDILDLMGTPQKLGKPVFSDLLNGNLTLPILILAQTSPYNHYINKILEEKELTIELQSTIVRGLNETSALNKAYLKAQDFCNIAKANLNTIPESPFRQYLLDLPDKLLSRCN